MEIALLAIGLFVSLVLYFTPTLVAILRRKRNLGAIVALNLLLGWTLIGWIVSLVWALTHDRSASDHVTVREPSRRFRRSR